MQVELLYAVFVPLFFVFLMVFGLIRVEVCRLSNVEAIQAVVEQLGRAKGEIVARIGALLHFLPVFI